MNKDISIKVENVYKSFRIPHEKTSSLKSAALNIFKRKTHTVFDAAKGISFEVKKGEFFGIIGRNGSGKSTILKMLAGIYLPNKGKITVNGNLSPFLELGVGFNPELTARENVYLNGTILGLTRKEIDEKFDDIIAFAELEEFIDQKLKNFSSGMQVRLAFAVAIHAHAEILLVDEVLAVGDINFQKKCFEAFYDFKKNGKTVVFVSHTMGHIREFCDRAIVIDKGHIAYMGEPDGAVDAYNKINISHTAERLSKEKPKKEAENVAERIGSGKAKIKGFKIFNELGKESKILKSGEKFGVELRIEFYDDVVNPALGIMFRKNPNENLFGLNNYYHKKEIGHFRRGDEANFVIESNLPLNPGNYYLTLSLSSIIAPGSELLEVQYEELDTMSNHLQINVVGPGEYWGLIYSGDAKFRVKNEANN